MVRQRRDTPEGKLATARYHETMKKKYGDKLHDHYAEMGRKGGLLGRSGGFASKKVGKDGLTGRERASIAGQKGGALSKRGKKKTDDCE